MAALPLPLMANNDGDVADVKRNNITYTRGCAANANYLFAYCERDK